MPLLQLSLHMHMTKYKIPTFVLNPSSTPGTVIFMVTEKIPYKAVIKIEQGVTKILSESLGKKMSSEVIDILQFRIEAFLTGMVPNVLWYDEVRESWVYRDIEGTYYYEGE
jgi:hypothetical protein